MMTNMFFGHPETDQMKEDLQRQKFVHSLVSHLSHMPSKNAASIEDQRDVITSNSADPVVSLRRKPSRIDQLKEKIKLVQEKLDLTEEKMKESQTSKKQLAEKLKILEKKISPGKILISDHPTEEDIEEWKRLAQAMKATDVRARKIKEMELKEKTMREGFMQMEQLLGRRHSSSSLNQ